MIPRVNPNMNILRRLFRKQKMKYDTVTAQHSSYYSLDKIRHLVYDIAVSRNVGRFFYVQI